MPLVYCVIFHCLLTSFPNPSNSFSFFSVIISINVFHFWLYGRSFPQLWYLWWPWDVGWGEWCHMQCSLDSVRQQIWERRKIWYWNDMQLGRLCSGHSAVVDAEPLQSPLSRLCPHCHSPSCYWTGVGVPRVPIDVSKDRWRTVHSWEWEFPWRDRIWKSSITVHFTCRAAQLPCLRPALDQDGEAEVIKSHVADGADIHICCSNVSPYKRLNLLIKLERIQDVHLSSMRLNDCLLLKWKLYFAMTTLIPAMVSLSSQITACY